MNPRILFYTILMTALGIGGIYERPSRPLLPDFTVSSTHTAANVARHDPAPSAPAAEDPPLIHRDGVDVEKPMPAAVSQPKADRRHAAARRYWEQQARRFEKLRSDLNQTGHPDERLALIRKMSNHVRMNTPETIAWAMELQDPNERLTALNAINQNSLSGIGARIAVDDTGYPLIQETTVMSAIAETGLVQPGDYIVGMDDGGSGTVYFEGLTVLQVAQHLRGEPGSELQLYMERVSPDGMTSEQYDVSVQRSMIVVEPLF